MAADGSDPQTATACLPRNFCDEPIWGPAATTARTLSAVTARASRARHSRRFARKVRRALERTIRQR